MILSVAFHPTTRKIVLVFQIENRTIDIELTTEEAKYVQLMVSKALQKLGS